MSEDTLRPTIASRIALPVETVELKRLKMESGAPVRIHCQRVDSLQVVRILEALPGGREKLDPRGLSAREIASKFRPFGSGLIEAGTALILEDESLRRPAFWDTTPVPDAFPIELLDTLDYMVLAMTLLRLNGYAGGAAEEASFSAGDAGGEGDGAGAVEVLEGDGDIAARGPE